VRTTVDGGIQVTTQTTTVELPHTITITGADVTAVNLIYTRDLTETTTPTWTSPENNPATDPYIRFLDGSWGIVAPDYDPVTPLYVNTGTVAVPLAQWNTNPPLGSVAPTGVYTYIAPDVHAWQFGIDGDTVFPNNVSINYSGNNIQFPRIIADSGKAFSVQGQGTSGSAALSWTVNPDAAGQYAAVAVSRAGGDNLAKVILQAQSDSGDVGTVNLWRFDETGTLALPTTGKIANGVDTAQVGSALTIADNGTPGGLTGWSSQALAVAYDANIIGTYPVGSTITFQDGSTATITQWDDYGPIYIDLFWDTPKTGDLFPITLTTTNYAAAYTAPEWTFGTDGRTTFPNGTVPEHSYGAAGDKEGMVVFSDPYIYYCKQDYVDNETDIWVRVAWTGTNW
jgi:hypothetical protein